MSFYVGPRSRLGGTIVSPSNFAFSRVARGQYTLSRGRATESAALKLGRSTGAYSNAGRPVAGYVIVVFTPDRSLWRPNARRIRVAPPAADGSFSVSSLPPGEYAIAAVEETLSDDLADPAFLSQLLASSVRVTLADGERKRQDLRTGR